MNKIKKYLCIISFDALSSLDFDYIKELPNFKSFIREASYCKNVRSVFPSLTYPAHTTIVTGKYPKGHGVINNTLFQPNCKNPDWYWYRKYIKGDTLYDLAIKEGMKVAALLWPVTGKSKIQYNMPEIFANKFWKNQTMVSLFSGSPMFQYKLNKKYGYLRSGIGQPYLDNFTHKSMLYTIENKKPNLTFVHYTDLDSMRHRYGFNSKEAREALLRHDSRLGDIISTLRKNNMYKDTTIVVLGDHSSLDENKIINLNVLLKENGYINANKNAKIIDYKAIANSCDGSTYIYTKKYNFQLVNKVYDLLMEFKKKYNCIEKIYSREEATRLGADPNCTFMIDAKKGYYFLDNINGKLIQEITDDNIDKIEGATRATHGYSPFKPNYDTVFMMSGRGINKGVIVDKMNLVDEAPTLAKVMGLDLKDCDGRVIEEFLLKKRG
ncbi:MULTISPECIES: alkaline phosphatase family protein [Clostridium]|uniref:Type I phosphodiesterase/nucleotide pyrophosphatase family protein n=1 Tax=Clostridium novyi (strain NT) TaxID=386415 RepID=A0Q2C6_CLONN|nr:MULTISPECIES: alkaline phosphatase family protein [Clostridium]ABK62371.1 type I phosphodiesterase/nucleotide pyrophosphatase family protein [Clostridium novyi NT]KEH85865.1 phosphodiesterase [Clostridium novyi A str. NCTC 538]KEH86953.1 phosphodiesterase [Clostridium novyi A str. 4540]KEH92661.1 phosphodiesterase [Clostridium botulinum C/D str. It1]KEH93488.1 phosphodiesterase [Clostridium novyi A str. GD211209]